ncbi:MAG: HAD family phosphatase [Acidobacteria bacterium]|nr:MAG: HAD family phosphatase [Acidobacteriota bacterium]REK01149.1 MAG: HAD family phosphatase [Acidobacteriota bacterium]REK14105.1 MAG: HAD family phosphatase [Acidobacteriota bacterium]REK44820.1 MAG: HAD family phosphatase [Acidobacteriota bacterium]
MVKAILMDFNGVVIDDEPIQMQAYSEVFKADGIDLSEEMYYDCLGMNDRSFVRAIASKAGVEFADEKVAEVVEAKSDAWRAVMEKGIPLFDGVEDFIKRMSNSFEVGLVSMARRKEIDHIFDMTGLGGYFSAVVTADDIASTKPDPECYRSGFRMIDAAHTSRNGYPLVRRGCVVIEDSPPGIQSAKGARLKALGITNTVAEEKLREAGADAVTDSLRDWTAESFRRVFG